MELIACSELNSDQSKQYKALLEESIDEPYLFERPLDPKRERMVVILDGDVVGCFEHGRSEYEGRSYFRANRPYTRKSYRGNNLMRKALKMWFEGRRPAMAWIAETNLPSIRMFQAVGFVRDKFFFNKRDGYFYFLR